MSKLDSPVRKKGQEQIWMTREEDQEDRSTICEDELITARSERGIRTSSLAL